MTNHTHYKMPKLLSINNYFYRRGGSDVVFLDHDEILHELGWDTAVMAMHHPKNAKSEWSRFFVDDIELGHEYTWRQKVVMAAKIIYSWEAKRKIALLLDRFPADIAHAHCIYHHISPSVFVELKRRGIPIVLTAHDLKLCCPAYKMLNRGGVCERCQDGNLLHLPMNKCIRDSVALSGLIMIESYVHRAFGLYRRYLDKVITPSRFYLEKHVEWGWPRDKLIYIPNYVDAARYEPEYSPGEHFFYFGRLSLEKGVGTLIAAAAQAGVRLRIAGTGPEGEALRERATRLGGQVEFLGFVSGAALWDEVRAARAVVLPSEWYENAPMSVLEAYACGKPVIGARIGGIPEMVREGETGALFNSGNVEELAEQLTRFAGLADHDVSAMGEAARRFLCETFTQQRYRDDMLTLYASLGVKVR